jgi:hypothetical protein
VELVSAFYQVTSADPVTGRRDCRLRGQCFGAGTTIALWVISGRFPDILLGQLLSSRGFHTPVAIRIDTPFPLRTQVEGTCPLIRDRSRPRLVSTVLVSWDAITTTSRDTSRLGSESVNSKRIGLQARD